LLLKSKAKPLELIIIPRKIAIIIGEDRNELREYLREYCQEFNLDLEEVMNAKFTKLIPASSRPYGNMYAY
jgi:glutamate synthase domain-containing protein 3